MKKGLKAFRFANKQWYFKNEKIEFIYNMIFLFFGAISFYFVYIVLYALLKY